MIMIRDMCSSLVVALCMILLFCRTCKSSSSDGEDNKCSSLCGGVNVSWPFRLMDSPDRCGDIRYELSCEHNQTMLYLKSGHGYNVVSINYENYLIRVRDIDVVERKISIPANSLTGLDTNYFNLDDQYTSQILTYSGKGIFGIKLRELAKTMLFISCRNPVNSPGFVDTASCFNISSSSSSLSFSHLYVNVGSETLRDLALDDGCGVELMYMTSWPEAWKKKNQFDWSCREIHNMLLYGFELSWLRALCINGVGDFPYLNGTNQPHCLVNDIWLHRPNDFSHFLRVISVVFFITVFAGIPILTLLVCHCACKCIVGPPFIIGLLIYKWRRRHLSVYESIEDFLQSDDNSITPIRYSYREIRKMTKTFRVKIGKGGYGSVYKGKLQSGRDVAVKMLDKTKGNGQDFISEVATLGRIHHFNVVQLIGYCAEGPKRALVYEFMENGSLDKYIFSKPNDNGKSLSLHQLYSISLGVARGIDYLHKGCNMQILHFDIKPHNILLDDDFIPKVSDFGLAKLYPTNNIVVPLTAARGTTGYIAPELFYRNVGEVSYKADVYSFGMLLMEIAGRRKNLNALVEQSSQIYFPFWVYDQLNEGNEINIEDATEEEMKVARKMMIIGLWCIQTQPSDRPSMNKVVEMLDGNEQDLELPQRKPFYTQDLPEVDDDDDDNSSSLITSYEPGECSSMDVIVELPEEKGEEGSKLSQESHLYALNLPTTSFRFKE